MAEGKELIGKRVLAYLIDGVVQVIAMVIGGAVGALLGCVFIPFMQSSEQAVPVIILANVGVFIGGFGYILLKDSFNGRSVGKRVMKLQVVRVDDLQVVGFFAAIIRNLFLFLGIIELAVALLQDEGRRVGDLVMGTKVVSTE